MSVDFADAARVKKRAQAWLTDEEMLLRRWFARAYRQPPNHPLFAEETLAYWHCQMVADNEQEAHQLRALLEKAPAASDPRQLAWRTGIQARLAELGGNVSAGTDTQLEADLAAAGRGEVPDFLKRRMSVAQGPLRHG